MHCELGLVPARPQFWTQRVVSEITTAMKAVLVQPDVVWENADANCERVGSLLRDAAPSPGSLIVLPEMFATGFSMNLAATLPAAAATEVFLQECARKLDCAIIGGLARAGQQDRGRNESVAFGPDGRLLARYCKMQPFTPGGEGQCHEPGEGPVFFEWGGMVVSLFVCYDLRFPELFRSAARRGAELMVVIAQWPARRAQHWVTLLQARAIENQACVIGVNRSGKDPSLEYPGRSLVVNPHGEIIADAGAAECVVSAALEPETVRQWRADFPALRDMRDDLGR